MNYSNILNYLYIGFLNTTPMSVNANIPSTTSISDIFNSSGIVANLGIMVVISTLFIYIFYKFFQRMENQNEKMFDKILNERKNEVKEHDDKMQIRISLNEQINSLLTILRIKTRASRAYIFEFHNSGINFTGLPFAKFSMTYEVIGKNTCAVITDYQNMPLSCLGNIVDKLKSFKPQINQSIEEFKGCNQILYGFLSSRNVEGYVYIGLKDSNNNIFAMLALNIPSEFLDEEDELKDIKICMYETASRVETLLDVIKH